MVCKRVLPGIVVAVAVMTAWPPLASAQADLARLTADAASKGTVRVIVRVGPGSSSPAATTPAAPSAISSAQDAVLSALAGTQAHASHKFRTIPFLALEVDPDGLDVLARLPGAEIFEDRLSEYSLAESVPLTGAPSTWSSGFDGTGQTVAVLDTGVDKSHAFLRGKIVSEACYSTTYAPYSSQSLCPGGASQSTATGSGVNCPVSIPGCAHGTHVAGIIAGRDPGGLGFDGVARGAKLIAIQVFSRFNDVSVCGSSTPCIRTYTSDQLRALERVYELRGTCNIAAVNMSLGSDLYSSPCDASEAPIKAAIDNLRSAGIATVIATGNGGSRHQISAPACVSSAVSVGATCDGFSGFCPQGPDSIADYSNIAPFMSLLAPGSLVLSAVPGNTYRNADGTSMAAPHVAGAWAVLKHRTPGASVTAVERLLQDTATAIDDTRSGGTATGLKRINFDQLLAQDSDHDNVVASADNCTAVHNPDQRDTDGDGYGNLCDADLNNDGIVNFADLAMLKAAFFTANPNADFDGDGVVNFADLAIMKAHFFSVPGPSGRTP